MDRQLSHNGLATVAITMVLLTILNGVRGLEQEIILAQGDIKGPHVAVELSDDSCGDLMALVSWKLGFREFRAKSYVVTCESSDHRVVEKVDAKRMSVSIGPLKNATEYVCSVQAKSKLLGSRKPVKSEAFKTGDNCECIFNGDCGAGKPFCSSSNICTECISDTTCTGKSDTCLEGTCVCGSTGGLCPGEDEICVSGVCSCGCNADELCYQDKGVSKCCGRVYSYGNFARDPPDVPTSGTFESLNPAKLSFSGTWTSDGPISNTDDTIGRLDGTPFSQVYGSSQQSGYASVQCASADREAIFTFDEPTVPGFGFNLGDVDAENVFLKALDEDGNELTGAELGYQSSFNYESQAGDVPVWVQADKKLQGSGSDTNGASAWFQPTKPIKSLVLTCNTIIGSPAYQLWMASPQCAP